MEDISSLIARADKGDLDAMFDLALWNIENDHSEEGLELILQAAEMGHAKAEEFLRRINADPETQFSEFLRMAENGNEDAMNALGRCYLDGDGVDKDEAAAIKWFRRAAQNGSRDAYWHLAECYLKGFGVAVSIDEAIRNYTKGYELGDADAAFAIAVMFHNGDGIEKDQDEAAKWYRRAIDAGL